VSNNLAAEFAAYVTQAEDAFKEGDLSQCRKYVSLAKMALAKIPDAATDGTSIRYANALAALDSALKDASDFRTGGIVSNPVEFWR